MKRSKRKHYLTLEEEAEFFASFARGLGALNKGLQAAQRSVGGLARGVKKCARKRRG